MQLKESEIIGFVRTRMAELSAESSDMLLDEVDDRNLEATIISLIGESLSYVHQKAAVNLLEGEIYDEQTPGITAELNADGSVDIRFTEKEVLRLVSFRMADSTVTLTEEVSEDSPQARMQSNEFARGTYDDPVLVRMADSADYKPHYVYYSVKDTDSPSDIQFSVSCFPVPARVSDENGVYSWYISAKLKEAVLNQVTGMTLRSYKDEGSAAPFLARCAEFLQ